MVVHSKIAFLATAAASNCVVQAVRVGMFSCFESSEAEIADQRQEDWFRWFKCKIKELEHSREEHELQAIRNFKVNVLQHKANAGLDDRAYVACIKQFLANGENYFATKVWDFCDAVEFPEFVTDTQIQDAANKLCKKAYDYSFGCNFWIPLSLRGGDTPRVYLELFEKNCRLKKFVVIASLMRIDKKKFNCVHLNN